MLIYLHEGREGRKLVYSCYHGDINETSEIKKEELSTLCLLQFPTNHPKIAYASTKRLLISYIAHSINDLPSINSYIHFETLTTPHRVTTFFQELALYRVITLFKSCSVYM